LRIDGRSFPLSETDTSRLEPLIRGFFNEWEKLGNLVIDQLLPTSGLTGQLQAHLCKESQKSMLAVVSSRGFLRWIGEFSEGNFDGDLDFLVCGWIEIGCIGDVLD